MRPSVPRSTRARLALGVALAALVATGLSGCGAIDTVGKEIVRHYSDGGDPYYGGGSGGSGDTDVDDLAVGDCFDDPEDDSYTVVSEDCGDQHDNEVTGIVTLAGDDYPGDVAIDKQSRAACETSLEDYVGVDFTDSSLDYSYWSPDQTVWESGDHDVICYAYNWSYDPLDSSVKGAGV